MFFLTCNRQNRSTRTNNNENIDSHNIQEGTTVKFEIVKLKCTNKREKVSNKSKKESLS